MSDFPKLPAPTWYGYPPDLVKRWFDFVRSNRRRRLEGRPASLRNSIESQEIHARSDSEMLARYRRVLREKRELVQMITEQLTPPDPMAIENAIEALLAMPEVIGTRVNHRGELVIMVRLVKEDYHLGDYEIIPKRNLYYGDHVDVYAARPVSTFTLSLPVVEQESDGRVRYRLSFTLDGEAKLAKLQLSEFVADCIQMMSRISSYRLLSCSSLNTEEPPEQLWDGFTANPVKALTILLENFCYARLRARLSEAEANVRSYCHEIDRLTARVREQHAELRKLRAELDEIERLLRGEVELDEKKVREELKYITNLEGVMGIRFSEDGIPIIHIRTSHLLEGRRFDLGDYEIKLTPNRCSRTSGVVHTTMTRRTADHPFYWHGGYHDYESSDGDYGWFCLGTRASELERLFQRGEFTLFMHLLLNTMNGINEGSRRVDYLLESYQEIPVDEVWVPRHRTRPRRRRRSTLEPVLMAVPDQLEIAS